MGVEDVAGNLELSLIEPEVLTVSAGQAIAESIAQPEPDIVTDDRAAGRNSEDRPR